MKIVFALSLLAAAAASHAITITYDPITVDPLQTIVVTGTVVNDGDTAIEDIDGGMSGDNGVYVTPSGNLGQELFSFADSFNDHYTNKGGLAPGQSFTGILYAFTGTGTRFGTAADTHFGLSAFSTGGVLNDTPFVGSVHINAGQPVPEPSSLLALGLPALALLRRRR